MAITRKQFAKEMTAAFNDKLLGLMEILQEESTADLTALRDKMDKKLNEAFLAGGFIQLDELYLSIITEVLKKRGVS